MHIGVVGRNPGGETQEPKEGRGWVGESRDTDFWGVTASSSHNPHFMENASQTARCPCLLLSAPAHTLLGYHIPVLLLGSGLLMKSLYLQKKSWSVWIFLTRVSTERLQTFPSDLLDTGQTKPWCQPGFYQASLIGCPSLLLTEAHWASGAALYCPLGGCGVRTLPCAPYAPLVPWVLPVCGRRKGPWCVSWRNTIVTSSFLGMLPAILAF